MSNSVIITVTVCQHLQPLMVKTSSAHTHTRTREERKAMTLFCQKCGHKVSSYTQGVRCDKHVSFKWSQWRVVVSCILLILGCNPPKKNTICGPSQDELMKRLCRRACVKCSRYGCSVGQMTPRIIGVRKNDSQCVILMCAQTERERDTDRQTE